MQLRSAVSDAKKMLVESVKTNDLIPGRNM